MPHAVFYNPTFPGSTSGAIVATISADMATIEGDGRAFVIVEDFRWDYDATCRVQDGAVVSMEQSGG